MNFTLDVPLPSPAVSYSSLVDKQCGCKGPYLTPQGLPRHPESSLQHPAVPALQGPTLEQGHPQNSLLPVSSCTHPFAFSANMSVHTLKTITALLPKDSMQAKEERTRRGFEQAKRRLTPQSGFSNTVRGMADQGEVKWKKIMGGWKKKKEA